MNRRKNGRQFVICVVNKGYEASLELRKVYQAIPDAKASAHHFLRIVDESGGDYLFPESCFVAVALPKTVRQAVLKAS